MAQTTWSQRQKIIEWLEIPANFNLITGQATKNMNGIVAGSKLKKTDAYRELADYVNEACGTNWNQKIAKSRYESYLKTYKETKKALYDTGNEKFMIGPKDIKMGIDTLEKKRDKMCNYYDRMDLLFGGRQNVVPSYVQETGRRTLEDLQEPTSDSEDMEDEEEELAMALSQVNSQSNSQTQLFEETQLEQDEEQQQDALAEETGNIFFSTPANKKRKRTMSSAAISAELKTLSASTINNLSSASDLSRSVANMKSGSAKKHDFSTAYAMAKDKELDFQKHKSSRELDTITMDMELKKADQLLRLQIHQDEMKQRTLDKKEDTRRQFMQTCIQQGKTAEEIRDILAFL